MYDYNPYSFELDLDGDGIMESEAQLTDMNGDGFVDSIEIASDLNHDGYYETYEYQVDNDCDGYFETEVEAVDTNNSGEADMAIIKQDTNFDGQADVVERYYDYNQDGVTDDVKIHQDSDGDGRFEDLTKIYDSDGDGMLDTTEVYRDDTGNGSADYHEVYAYDPGTNEIIPADNADYSLSGTYYQDLDNFDPDSVTDPDLITGDPEESMDYWEFQGDTNRCALYSQMFVIEEFTGEDIDMEEFAQTAEENGWFTESGTYAANVNKMLDYYGIENEMSFHQSIDDVEDCLDNGGRVIVSIDADEIWHGKSNDIFAPDSDSNHMVEVIGIDRSDPDNPMVILNDSGSPYGKGEMVPLEVFEGAWSEGDNQMIACYPS